MVPTLSARRSLLRRRRIVDAAARLFAAAQYDAVQIDDVARAARVAKPTLYRYFATKEELFLEGLDELLGELAGELTEVVERRHEASRALPEMIHVLLDRLGGHHAGIRALDGSDKKRFGKHVRTRLCTRNKQIRGSFAAILRRGIDQEEFRDLDPDLVASAIIGSLRAIATKIPVRRRAVVARLIGEVLVDGIASRNEGETTTRSSRVVAQIDALGVD